MAWTCSAGTHADLTAALVSAGLLHTPALATAFGAVDRGAFVPSRSAAVAYADAPQGIGWGATISAPHMHAMCLELLGGVLGLQGGDPDGRPGKRDGVGGGGVGVDGGGGGDAPSTPPRRVLDVLDVGVGSGYLAAVLAVALGSRGRVVGVDHVAELVSAAADSLGRVGVPVALEGATPATAAAAAAAVVAEAGGGAVVGAGDGSGDGGGDGGDGGDGGAAPSLRRNAPPGTVELHVADGRVGLAGRTWDAIHVGAAADGGVPPPALVAALKVGGRMVVPVGGRRGAAGIGGGQVLVTVDRVAPGEGGVVINEVCGVRYVPLCGEGEQRGAR
ncbi:hypothetical protein MMPV_002295 [Pyropia vietnamensis]